MFASGGVEGVEGVRGAAARGMGALEELEVNMDNGRGEDKRRE